MPELYAIKVHHGIKIGYAKDASSRIKSHKTLGMSVPVLKIVSIDDSSIDGQLKKYMKELKLIVSVPDNTQTTEVYNMTDRQSIALLNYIEAFQEISIRAIKDVMNGDAFVKYVDLSYLDICNNYGSQYKRPIFQRGVSQERVNQIKEFIMENYAKRNYYMPTILMAKSDEENERYIIIDGQHRCAAISAIPKSHPCMQNNIQVVIYPILTTKEQLGLFRDINKSVPVPAIYLDSEYVVELLRKVCERLDKNYGIVVNRNKQLNKFSHEINYNVLFELITNDNLNNLWQQEVIMGISDRDVFQFLKEFNAALIDEINTEAEDDSYLKNKGSGNDKAVLALCNRLNGNTTFSSGALMKAINDIRKRPKPFVLGLFFKLSIIDLYREITSDL